jgi:hypothetical protein
MQSSFDGCGSCDSNARQETPFSREAARFIASKLRGKSWSSCFRHAGDPKDFLEGGIHIAQIPQKRIQCDLKIFSGEKAISQRNGRELTPARRESLRNQLVRMDL